MESQRTIVGRRGELLLVGCQLGAGSENLDLEGLSLAESRLDGRQAATGPFEAFTGHILRGVRDQRRVVGASDSEREVTTAQLEASNSPTSFPSGVSSEGGSPRNRLKNTSPSN